MTNQEKFIQIFGIVAWQAMIVFTGLAEQFKEYWTSPHNGMDCRDCKAYEDCPCGKDGHESETSQGYSIGECKDFEPQQVRYIKCEVLDKIRDEVLEYIDDLDIAAEICDIFDKYKTDGIYIDVDGE